MTSQRGSLIDEIYQYPGRATRAIIDLDVISANVRRLRQLLSPSTKFMAVVKADGYGHGAVMVSRAALAAGAEMLGVATVGEAADLRAHGVTEPIVLLGPCDGAEVTRALGLGVELTVGSRSMLDRIAAEAESNGQAARVHLKIDTGMHRFGASPEYAAALAERAESLRCLELTGISTHLVSADEPGSPITADQLTLFKRTTSEIRMRLGRSVATHAANSAGVIHGLAEGTEIARVGIAMFGLPPGPRCVLPVAVEPALSVLSRLSRVHQPADDAGVSYGHLYRCAAGERLGLLPIGYADGYRRGLSDRGWVSVRGARCSVRGRICMDQTVIGDLPDDAEPDDAAGICGPIGGGPSIDELAGLLGTINYEIAAGIGSRVERYYLSGGRVVGTLIEGRLEQW